MEHRADKTKAKTPLLGTVLQDMEWGVLHQPNSFIQFDPPITLMAEVLPSLSSHSAFVSALWRGSHLSQRSPFLPSEPLMCFLYDLKLVFEFSNCEACILHKNRVLWALA